MGAELYIIMHDMHYKIINIVNYDKSIYHNMQLGTVYNNAS